MTSSLRQFTLDNIELSLFINRLQSVCTEMGATLRCSSLSPNIKDRLDFSCAIFDPVGALCAQAAHIPVHLGSMAFAMEKIVGNISWNEGDVILVNDPYLGGTHLPDVTVIQPIFYEDQLVAFCANRAHHADIGCDRPGSMPLSTDIHEEGLVIKPRHYLRNNEKDPDTMEILISSLRNPSETLADFAAQISANRAGVSTVLDLIQAMSLTKFKDGLKAINLYAENMARISLQNIPNGIYDAEDYMDGDGISSGKIRIKASLTFHDNSVSVDFAGTSAAVTGNINCPLSVTAAAVYYSIYALMPEGTPACMGSMRPIDIRAPKGCLLNAEFPAAVAAGNVETSQRVVDVLLMAIAKAIPNRIPASSQGTMNNIAMGGKNWDYYETIGGGTGAHSKARGLDGTHSHMTNTLNTPIEILETSYPLRVLRYSFRKNTGGKGTHRGGDGLSRHYQFLSDTEITILSERRASSPKGLNGGQSGKSGGNFFNSKMVPGKVQISAKAGDSLLIETPGGGGWGKD